MTCDSERGQLTQHVIFEAQSSMASDFVGEVLDTLANGDPSPLKVIWALALAVKEAYDGVQGNKEQCKMLNDHVQLVANSLKELPPATRKKKDVEDAMQKLVETLRSAEDLIAGFKKQGRLKRLVKQNSTAAKFDDLFSELDKMLTICGFALEVRRVKRKSGGGRRRESFLFFVLSFCFLLWRVWLRIRQVL